MAYARNRAKKNLKENKIPSYGLWWKNAHDICCAKAKHKIECAMMTTFWKLSVFWMNMYDFYQKQSYFKKDVFFF